MIPYFFAKNKILKLTIPSTDNGDQVVLNSDPVASSPTAEPPSKKRKRQPQGFKEDPFVFFSDDEPVWPAIR